MCPDSPGANLYPMLYVSLYTPGTPPSLYTPGYTLPVHPVLARLPGERLLRGVQRRGALGSVLRLSPGCGPSALLRAQKCEECSRRRAPRARARARRTENDRIDLGERHAQAALE